MGQKGQFAPGPQGLRGLTIEDFNILTAGNALNGFSANLKGLIEKFPCRFACRGASFHSFVPGPPKALGGPAEAYSSYCCDGNISGKLADNFRNFLRLLKGIVLQNHLQNQNRVKDFNQKKF